MHTYNRFLKNEAENVLHSRVLLRRNSNNKDGHKEAIEVVFASGEWKSKLLGHVSKEQANLLSPLLDTGVLLFMSCTVSAQRETMGWRVKAKYSHVMDADDDIASIRHLVA